MKNVKQTMTRWMAVPPAHFAICVAIVAACTALNWLFKSWLSPTDAAMAYLLGVMVAAVYFERPVSIAAALLSFLAFDFFFVPPIFTLHFESVQYLITGLVLLIVGLVTGDLASRLRREMKNAAQAELTAQDERLRHSLLASLSHDLRTPLAVIAGTASSLRDNRHRMTVEEQDQLLETIFQRSASMSVEVSDLLEMTRLNAGRVSLDRQWYPLEELISSAVERCRSVIGPRALSVALPAEVCLLRVDGVLIEKLFVNLLENAALHTPIATKLEIFAVRGQDALTVFVRDDGPGLPPGGEDRLFAMFERGSRAGISTGSGLGLSICRAIAELHGLTMIARNRAEGGAEFCVTFPIEPAPSLPPLATNA